MHTRFRFAQPEWLETVDSTNDELKRRFQKVSGLSSAPVVAAKFQTTGKGRLGRVWHCSPDAGAMFSFVWSWDLPMDHIATLPLACGLGVLDFLCSVGAAGQCKWPNDIMVDGKKICGILCESTMGNNGSPLMVVGMGLNINPDPEREKHLQQPCAHLPPLVEGRRNAPEEILPFLLRSLEQGITQWQQYGFGCLYEKMNRSLWGMNTEVKVRTGPAGQTISGRIKGVSEKGELILRGADGREQLVVSAAALDPC